MNDRVFFIAANIANGFGYSSALFTASPRIFFVQPAPLIH